MASDRAPRGYWRDQRTGREWRATKRELQEANRLFAKQRALERREERADRFAGKPPRPKPGFALEANAAPTARLPPMRAPAIGLRWAVRVVLAQSVEVRRSLISCAPRQRRHEGGEMHITTEAAESELLPAVIDDLRRRRSPCSAPATRAARSSG